MKKTNTTYVAKQWVVSALLILIEIVLLYWFRQNTTAITFLSLAFVATIILSAILIPGKMRKSMEKHATALEKSFPEKDFHCDYKFTAHNSVFFIDTSGKLAVMWKNNPAELYFVNPSMLSEVRVNDGKQLRGTSIVSCQFKLDGENFKIQTLRVSNGQLSMNDKRVIEAIGKAQKICDMLNETKANAVTIA